MVSGFLILRAALGEILKESNVPKMAQLVCSSKMGAQVFWIQSLCL